MAATVLVGRAGSPGLGTGRLLPLPAGAPDRDAPDSASTGDQAARLAAALEGAAADLEALAEQLTARAGAEVGAIFEAQALFARDPGIIGPAFALIDTGVAADEAILQATDEQAERLASVDDAYFRERAADVRDVGRRVASLVRGEAPPDLLNRDGHPAILVAADLDPSTIATLRRELVAGIALGGGAESGHAAIVARALGIPLVLGLGAAIDELVAGSDGAVDGSNGRLLIGASEDELATLAGGILAPPVVSTERAERVNGVAVLANVGSAHEAELAWAADADGIGLVRTELLFLGRRTPPTIAEQRAAYRAILAAMHGRPVVFRTLDVGGDKPAAWQDAGEQNPALGVRGLRLGLRLPTLLDDQLSALLEAADGAELRIMLPMVSAREELDAARARLDAVCADLAARGRPVPDRVQLGVMIEVPSAALMADALATSAAFFSIGTNDLVQYTLAADRTSPALADLATPDQPAILRLIDGVVRAATPLGRHVAVCGEAAANPALLPLLLGLGVGELSVTPASVGPIRAAVATLDLERCREVAARALRVATVAEVRTIVAEAGLAS